MFYAITLTASPHKKHMSPHNSMLKSSYKNFSVESQRKLLQNFLERCSHNFIDYRHIYEECPTSGLTHVHMCVQPRIDHSHMYPEDIVQDFLEAFRFEFGYHGKNNKPEHFYMSKEILTMMDYEHWEEYMYKEVAREKLV